MALPRVPMVEFLVKNGFVKPEQVDEAKRVQEQTKETDLGRVLVQLGMVGEREVLEARAAARKLRVKVLRPDVAGLLGGAAVRRDQVLRMKRLQLTRAVHQLRKHEKRENKPDSDEEEASDAVHG